MSALPVRELATGPRVLLLLHGAGMDGGAWEPQLAALATGGIAAVAPSFPGHGLSEGAPLNEISALTSWLLRLTEAMGGTRWALAGHSMGALLALELSARAQERIVSLALIGAAMRMPVNPDLLTAAREDVPKAAALISRWGYGARARADGRAELGRQQLASSRPGVLASI